MTRVHEVYVPDAETLTGLRARVVATGGIGPQGEQGDPGSGIELLTTKGDLLGYSTEGVRVPVGTNGHVLTADSTATPGLKWAAPDVTQAELDALSSVYQPLDADLTDLAGRWSTASASGASALQFLEDTDNGTNKVTLTAPASLASDVTVTLPSATGTLITTADNPSDLTPDTLVTETGTSFTLSSTHDGRTVICSNAGLVTVTIPTDAGDDLRDGFRCVLVSTGAGGVTLSTSGITLLPATPNKTVATGEGLYVEKSTAANTWVVLGGTAA